MLTLAGLALLVALLLVIRRWVATGRRLVMRRAGIGVAVCWVGLVAIIALRPLAAQPGPRQVVLIPFTDSGGSVELFSNVLLFVPLGAALYLIRPSTKLAIAALTGVASAVIVEAIQYAQHCGRVADTTDIITNALGAIAGFAIAGLAGRTASTASLTTAQSPMSPVRGRNR